MSRTKPLPKNLNDGKWIEVSRIQAATQQLDTAIELYFTSSDEVSVHTLVHAAIGILNPIVKAKGGPDLLLADSIKEDFRAGWLALVKEGSNFFKHGSPDVKAKVHFRPEWNTLSLCTATDGHRRAVGNVTLKMHVFSCWMRMKYPDIFLKPDTESDIKARKAIGDMKPDAFYRYMVRILGRN